MTFRRSALCVALAAACLSLHVGAQVRPPMRYDAVQDREPRAEPTLPSLGAAGTSFFDPVFSSQLWRVTDAATRPNTPNRSYRTPSGTHQNAWSADSAYFYVVSTDGTVIPFAFDPATERARRIEADGASEGGLVLRFYNEPHFSYTRPGVIYGSASGSGATLRTIDAYDFSRNAYERILDLDQLVPGLAGTYVGGIGSSSGDPERLITFFGGVSQDRHRYVAVFDRQNTSRRRLVDTVASTIDGRPTNITLNFRLHHAFIDRSGRYALLYPTSGDRQAPRNAAPVYLWDIDGGTFSELPSIAARSNGHDTYGYAVMVNQDCCTTTTWDAAQWQFRRLDAPMATRDLISPIVQPKSVYLAEHPSWHNARPDTLTPFVTALYRYGANDVPWRAWDDEIVGVETAADGGATVWRFAHHRSDVRHDDDPVRIGFWYTPRPNVSSDGRYVLFTSNWEKRLGTDPAGETGTKYRQDVFLLKLRPADGTRAGDENAEPIEILTQVLPSARRTVPYSTILEASGGGGALQWRLERGSLPPGLQLNRATGEIAGTARSTGTWLFTAGVTDGRSNDRRSFSLTVRR
ncbi:MAG TPA: Ig domain-containing protein [Vicinamibacterales bacterium]|nr:Ig domain-containing protein [Vicinamibacterales bacterium]